LPNTKITAAQPVTAGEFTPPGRTAGLKDLPPFCRVAATLTPSADSDIKVEIWFPLTGWNGKYRGQGNGGFAGSITCALFLQRFVEAAKSWLHVDIYGWTPSAKPARPEGGECQAARAIYQLLSQRYG
jgi:leucyl aminopeptidase